MATTGAGDGGLLFGGAFEGSIPGSHLEVDRRPYHKNCTCALHSRSSSSRGVTCPHHKPSKVYYPIKRSWSEGSFALYPASPSLNPSPSSSSSSAIDFSKATPPISRTSSSSTFDFLSSTDC